MLSNKIGLDDILHYIPGIHIKLNKCKFNLNIYFK
jgi:hypothetical protein